LDEIPSPYTSGLLDKFFDGKYTPLVETARGCPFKCNFCNAGDDYFNKVNKFSDEYVRDELTYIAEKSGKLGLGHVTFADNNFGMIPRDATTTEVIHGLRKEHNWPQTMTVWTGKNSKQRVIDYTRLLEDTIQISMSVQSMDNEVLKNISRDNIKLDDYRAIATDLDRQGRKQSAEVVMPLPGETLESHLNGLNDLLDTKLSNVFSHTLQMLHGTPYKDNAEYVKSFGYKTKFRLVPLDFSLIGNDRIFDVEEVGIATKDFPFEDYIIAREYLLTLDMCFSTGIFKPLLRHLEGFQVSVSLLISKVFSGRNEYSLGIQEIFKSFVEETKSELWDSEEELVSYYSIEENFERLVAGDVGGNVLFKHRIRILSEVIDEWVEIIFNVAKALYKESHVPKEAFEELESLKSYVSGTVSKLFNPDTLKNKVERTIKHDVVTWINSNEDQPLSDFIVFQPVSIYFTYSERDTRILIDAFKRYGNNLSGIVKLVQRVVNIPLRTASMDATLSPNSISEAELSSGTMSPGNFST
jgi:hypothetical protein